MAKTQPKPATLDERLADIEKLIVEACATFDRAAHDVASNPTDRALSALHAAQTEVRALESQRDALELARRRQAETRGASSQAAEPQRRSEAIERLQTLLGERATVSRRVAEAFEELAPALIAFQRVQEDVRGIAMALCRGAPHDRLPDPTAADTDRALLDILYRSGVGRTGPRLGGNRVTVMPLGIGRTLPLDEAIASDNQRLLSGVLNAMDTKPVRRQTWIEQEQERVRQRRSIEQTEQDARDAKANEAERARLERRARRAADTTPMRRDEHGHVVKVAQEIVA
jgi:hypothetical protein